MDFIGGLVLIVCGLLCIPAILIKKKPEAKDIIDKIVPYQGMIGLVICVWGILDFIFWLAGTGHNLSQGLPGFIAWVSELGASALSVLVGFLLGFGLMKTLALKNASDPTKEKIESIHTKLAKVQIPLGFAAVIGGAWIILYSIIYNIF